MWIISLLLGCPGPGETGDTGATDGPPFACEPGEEVEGAFVSYAERPEAELVLGFQGFLFLEVRVRAEDPPSQVQAVSDLQVDGESVGGGVWRGVTFTDGLSDTFLVYLTSSNVAQWTDRDARLALRLQDEGGVCLTTTALRLVDEDPCIHADDEPICPEDTGS